MLRSKIYLGVIFLAGSNFVFSYMALHTSVTPQTISVLRILKPRSSVLASVDTCVTVGIYPPPAPHRAVLPLHTQ